MPIIIEPFVSFDTQVCNLGIHQWSVARLVELSKDLKVMLVPLEHLNISSQFGNISMRDLIQHYIAIEKADLSFPIILDEDGELMDGRHRLMKAIILKEKKIKVVRFTKNPRPCKILKD